MRLLRDALRVLAFGTLAALSLPGVHAARAGTDLLPPAKQFFSWKVTHPAQPSGSPSCGGDPAVAMRQAQAGREAALAQIAQAMGAVPGGGGEPLNGRGYGYAVRTDPSLELIRIQQEAQRLQAAQQPPR